MLWGAAFWQAPVVLLTHSFQPLTFPFSFGEWGVIGQITVTSLASILYFESCDGQGRSSSARSPMW